ncbi:ribulose-phosphate 3-epimerase [Alicyclobacillus tolerans]|uniref:ribulose-phosphate 3-epimerase n=1 Tax=Alicyclobacillus TaxID=29330 RepID=UPI000934F345|nr:ribulose-phosphate 3-epimerase [Alicyclobacillus sp. TC]
MLAPSILSADFSRLSEQVDEVVVAGAEWIHVDVMDGHFVPNLSMGPVVVDALRKSFPSLFLDVHLMVEAPEKWITSFAKSGANRLTIHAESTPHVHRAIQMIRSAGLQAGIAFNPATGLDTLAYIVEDVDLVLVMTVNPGFGGQHLIPATLPKISEVRRKLIEYGCSTAHVQVDGGISLETLEQVMSAGANVIVAGSAIFEAAHPKERVQEFLSRF